jgi:hypothetical protein
MGGVLFIDEAYYLYRASDSRDYGQEVIDILLQVMENDRDKLVVILAGYKDRMDEFFEVNPGMNSRIAHHLDFAAYEMNELVDIGRVMLQQSSYYLSGEAELAFREYLTWRQQQPEFANARSVRNELEHARLRHAHRLAACRGAAAQLAGLTVQVLLGQPRWRAGQPAVQQRLAQRRPGHHAELDEHRGIPVEMRDGEEHVRLRGQHRLLLG